LIDLKLLELTCNANALFMNLIGKPNNDFAKQMHDARVYQGWNDKKLSAGSKGDCKSEEEDARLC